MYENLEGVFNSLGVSLDQLVDNWWTCWWKILLMYDIIMYSSLCTTVVVDSSFGSTLIISFSFSREDESHSVTIPIRFHRHSCSLLSLIGLHSLAGDFLLINVSFPTFASIV